ncbi:MAG: BadF/BadG/BcrA/BcrD ATPase family protein [Terrimesophilobacter sp.]
MQRILAIDAGGTSTRALVVEPSGTCLGYGHSGGGNPVSSGIEGALASVLAATRAAFATVPPEQRTVYSALIAMAGASSELPTDQLAAQLTTAGLLGELVIESDLLAMFCSGTPSGNGYVLVAGTGAVAARISDTKLQTVSDGVGWLLGDEGSGFWIGQHVVRAVIADLDGRAPHTSLTAALLAALNLTATEDRTFGRPLMQIELIRALYKMRPIELAQFSPMAFEAGEDAVASGIRTQAATELAGTLAAVRLSAEHHDEPAGPLVVGGSVLRALANTEPLASALREAAGNSPPIPVQDGVVGAAVLGLTRVGIDVDHEIFERITRGVAMLRAGT